MHCYYGRFRSVSPLALFPVLFFRLPMLRPVDSSIWLLLPLLASWSVSICLSPNPVTPPAVAAIGAAASVPLLPFSRAAPVFSRLALGGGGGFGRWRIGFPFLSRCSDFGAWRRACFGFLILMTIAGSVWSNALRGGGAAARWSWCLPSAKGAAMSPSPIGQRGGWPSCRLACLGQCPRSCAGSFCAGWGRNGQTFQTGAGLQEVLQETC